MTKRAPREYIATKSGRRVEVRVRMAGQYFGHYGQLVERGKVIAETEVYPFGMAENAKVGARLLAEKL